MFVKPTKTPGPHTGVLQTSVSNQPLDWGVHRMSALAVEDSDHMAFIIIYVSLELVAHLGSEQLMVERSIDAGSIIKSLY